MRQLLAKVRDAILFVYETHGLGYGTVVCRDLIRAELDYQGIAYQSNPLIQVEFQGTPIRACKAKVLCIAEQMLCGITAIQDKVTLFDIKRMRTYLNYSNIPLGLLVNFGKSNFEIRAVFVD